MCGAECCLQLAFVYAVYTHVGDVYGNVQEDYFSFNKIPRILFEHLKRYPLCADIRTYMCAYMYACLHNTCI